MGAHIDGAHYDAIVTDLDHSVDAMIALLERDSALWTRRRPGKWTAGQHADHVAKALALMLPPIADSARRMAAGQLPKRPWRGPLQSLFFALVVTPGRIPRGGPAIPPTFPADAPVLAEVTRALREHAARYREAGAGLDSAARGRLWIPNPFMTWLRWQYSLPEAVHIQAVHVRHHATQIEELARV